MLPDRVNIVFSSNLRYHTSMIELKELRLLPNMLSLSRILFLPLLYTLFFLEHVAAFLMLYAVIGVTDMLDGLIARKMGLISRTGQFLDSLADICFNLSTAFFLVRRIPRISQEYIHLLTVLVLLGIVYLAITLVKFRRVHFIHTNLFRTAGVCIYVCFIISFFIEPIFFSRLVMLLLILSFVESILICLIYGEVDPDIRYITRIKNQQDE